jgi:copper transporter 1
MLFTWSTQDLCIVFKGWHIRSTGGLLLSLLAIVLMTAGYEAVREMSRRYELYASRLNEGRRGGDDLRGELYPSCSANPRHIGGDRGCEGEGGARQDIWT